MNYSLFLLVKFLRELISTAGKLAYVLNKGSPLSISNKMMGLSYDDPHVTNKLSFKNYTK